ncbi:peroxisomal biogenesis factor 11 [Dipodascopsis uninucleata]
MVADAVMYHPTISHLLKFMDTTVGRDKLMRFIQYFARFYAAYLARKGVSAKDDSIKWKLIMSQFAYARKLLRLGKPLQHLKAAAVAYDNKTADAILRYTAIGRQLSYAVYLTMDMILVGQNTKIITLKNPQLIQKSYYRFWLAGITFSLVSSVYKHVALSQREASLAIASEKDVSAIKKVRQEKRSNLNQLTLDVLDSSIPISALALLPVDDGVVGLNGMISSFMGILTQWSTTIA